MQRPLLWISSVLGVLLVLAAWYASYTRAQSYDAQFFEQMNVPARRSAQVVVPELVRLLKPTSIVDVGSGDGYWAKAFMEHGVSDILAIDGPWVKQDHVKVPPKSFLAQDFSQRLSVNRTFDVALCLETAEHLTRERAESFVSELVALAPVVVFSAAIPEQGGTMHYNEQWPSFWAERFARHSYVALDVLRPHFWNDPEVAPMYRQNMLLYVRADTLQQHANLTALPSFPGVLPLVHPAMFHSHIASERYAGRWQTKLKRALALE